MLLMGVKNWRNHLNPGQTLSQQQYNISQSGLPCLVILLRYLITDEWTRSDKYAVQGTGGRTDCCLVSGQKVESGNDVQLTVSQRSQLGVQLFKIKINILDCDIKNAFYKSAFDTKMGTYIMLGSSEMNYRRILQMYIGQLIFN